MMMLILWGCVSSCPDHPVVNTQIDRAPLYIQGDSVIVQPWQLAFGSDPNIRLCDYPKNAPNPFSRRSGFELINLTPDTLTIRTVGDNENSGLDLYRGYLGKGYFIIRLYAADDLVGWLPVTVTVGNETKTTKAYFIPEPAN
jgi:hypothetical protein